jgi:SAM-dependent methyltransferase
VDTLASGPLRSYWVVDGAPQMLEAFHRQIDPAPNGLVLLEGFFETFACPIVFDVIEAGFIFEHVENPLLVLRRMHQFLAPGGRIFIAVPNARSLHRRLGQAAGFLEDLYALSPADLALGHKRYFDVDRLTKLVGDAGFQVAKVEGMLLKPFTSNQLHSLNLTPAVWQALVDIADVYPDISNAICLEATT